MTEPPSVKVAPVVPWMVPAFVMLARPAPPVTLTPLSAPLMAAPALFVSVVLLALMALPTPFVTWIVPLLVIVAVPPPP